jgi:hypothetical protein
MKETNDMVQHNYLQAVRELHFWQYGQNSFNFSSLLYVLMQKADSNNRVKLAIGFPVEYEAFCEWSDAPSQDAFFEKYGLKSFTILYDHDLT